MTRQGGERGRYFNRRGIPQKSPNTGVGNSVSIEPGAGPVSPRNGLGCREREVQFVSGREVGDEGVEESVVSYVIRCMEDHFQKRVLTDE
ncbi:hypothetical protein NPIL_295781 [Nephila pilipes]|uniref:Uncharacterized protein n=1 Tax=Nephila pilipes TaxID=299642 RepID=A0A8X6NM86_NEPPI|nr:hypothetical protein NPIL_295781 [Nephila pilipes]